jgi:predicted O-methyltransferase YrrM
MRVDPFALKRHAKWHPKRLSFTITARLLEWESRKNFSKYSLPEKLIPNLPPAPEASYENTAVTPVQMQHLLYALAATEHLTDTVVVEVGSYRGVTAQILAKATSRKVVAIDPYQGYGGSDEDLLYFQSSIKGLSNVVHERLTSGEAIRTWRHGFASFVFIDAVHDYVNTKYDFNVWSEHTVTEGIIAMHDTDQISFAGTRKAAYKACMKARLLAHPYNLVICTV